jgi:hypothetical protein
VVARRLVKQKEMLFNGSNGEPARDKAIDSAISN